MAQEDRKVLNMFTDCVRRRFPDARIWTFGSRARGNAAWDSDFDLFIVLNELNQETDLWIRDIAWEIGFENDLVITTVLIDQEQLERGPMSASTLVATILREGISA